MTSTGPSPRPGPAVLARFGRPRRVEENGCRSAVSTASPPTRSCSRPRAFLARCRRSPARAPGLRPRRRRGAHADLGPHARPLCRARARARGHDPRIVVKAPTTVEGTAAAAKLRDEGVRITMTAVYSAAQALVASALGADYAAPYLGRMNDAGRDGFGEIARWRGRARARLGHAHSGRVPARSGRRRPSRRRGARHVHLRPETRRRALCRRIRASSGRSVRGGGGAGLKISIALGSIQVGPCRRNRLALAATAPPSPPRPRNPAHGSRSRRT